MSKFISRLFVIFAWTILLFLFPFLSKLPIFSRAEKSLTIFSWGDSFDPRVIEAFEKETGIKIHLNAYSSNEELLVKLRATKGKGYDLIVPSDYVIPFLSEEGLLEELQREKLLFWSDLNPLLLGHAFDMNNRFSIPFQWEIFGFGYDKSYFTERPLISNWQTVFDPSLIDYKITMINDPIETLFIATHSLFGDIEKISTEQLTTIKGVLIEQKKWVEAYSDFRGDYFLATKNCPLVVASSSYIVRSMRKFPFIGFTAPKGGYFISIENLAIPKASKKKELVYQFLNYIYRPDALAQHTFTYGFFPVTLSALEKVSSDPSLYDLLYLTRENRDKFFFTRLLISQQQLRDFWIEIKSTY